MIGKKRVAQRTLRQKRLHFTNPFYTTGYNPFQSKIHVAPIQREGVTSVEHQEALRALKRYKEAVHAGIIPDELGVDLKDFMGDAIALPEGVQSVEAMEKQMDAERKIQRFNAGIMDKETKEMKTLYKLAKQRKKQEMRNKIVQWLAETDEIDTVPNEFAEEVEAYYRSPNATVTKANVEQQRKDRKEREESRAHEERMRAAYWEQPKKYREYWQDQQGQAGRGQIGWRAPRLHRLVRPLAPFNLGETPTEIMDEQRKTLEERRKDYQKSKMDERGVPPPRDMVKRAFPDNVRPLSDFIAETSPAVRALKEQLNAKLFTPHDFIVPRRKFKIVF